MLNPFETIVVPDFKSVSSIGRQFQANAIEQEQGHNFSLVNVGANRSLRGIDSRQSVSPAA